MISRENQSKIGFDLPFEGMEKKWVKNLK